MKNFLVSISKPFRGRSIRATRRRVLIAVREALDEDDGADAATDAATDADSGQESADRSRPERERRARTRPPDPFRRIPDDVIEASVKTLIDVGTAHGTRRFYRRFPEASVLLIDPLEENESAMKQIADEHGGSYELCVVGAEAGEVTLRVPTGGWLTRTSLLERTDLTEFTSERAERQVPMHRLDDVVRRHDPAPPFGLKIDTEGFELEVLRGAPETLPRCAFVVCEASIAPRFHDSYRFAELVGHLDASGFDLHNILHVSRSGGLAKYADLLFVRSDRAAVESPE